MDQNQPIPTPEQIEKAMVEKEVKAQKANPDPLDTHAQLFYFFNPRFQNTVGMMSKKPLIRLMQTLAGSEFNKAEDVNKLAKITTNMNVKGIARVITSVIEHPLNGEATLIGKSEEKLFELFDGLLANKYYTCLQKGIEKKQEDSSAVQEIEDVITHNHNLKEFNSRELIEKDAFAIGNKLLASKFLMMLVTHLREMEKQKNEKENSQTSGS